MARSQINAISFQIPLHNHVQVSRFNTHLEQTRGLKLCIYIYIHILVHYIMYIYIYTRGLWCVYNHIYIYIYISTGSPTKLRHGSMFLGPQNTMVMSFLLLVWPNLCNQDDFLFVHTHILFVGLIYGWILYSCAKINSCLHGLSYLKHRSKLHSMWTLFVGQKSI